ncbi:MAG: hypothetical protein H0W72_08015 [Planctomycetes bacterium]|nr:hypothetical protein [Planctomycetota bacterium]
MTEMPELSTPEQRRRNVILGWKLGALVIAIVIGFMVLFTSRGLPKTPKVAERMLREESANDLPPTPAPAPSTPTTAPIGADDKASNVAPAQEPAR